MKLPPNKSGTATINAGTLRNFRDSPFQHQIKKKEKMEGEKSRISIGIK
jgi:hypothetical protein